MRMKSLAALLTGLLSISCFFAIPALADDADGQAMQQAAPSDNIGQTDATGNNNTDSNTDNNSNNTSGSGDSSSGSPDTATGEDY